MFTISWMSMPNYLVENHVSMIILYIVSKIIDRNGMYEYEYVIYNLVYK